MEVSRETPHVTTKPKCHDLANILVRVARGSAKEAIRPISLLRLSLLRFVDSTLPGKSLWTWEFHPLNIKILLESDPLKSRILVRRLTVTAPPRRRIHIYIYIHIHMCYIIFKYIMLGQVYNRPDRVTRRFPSPRTSPPSATWRWPMGNWRGPQGAGSYAILRLYYYMSWYVTAYCDMMYNIYT